MGLPLLPLLALLGCEPINTVEGTIDSQIVTITSAWWTRYVSVDGTEHPQYRVTLSDMEDGCNTLLDYHADLADLEERYDDGDLSPEEFVAEAEENFAAHMPSDLWQVVVEFLVQEGTFTELRLEGSEWDRYPQTGEIGANFIHQTGLRYSSVELTERYVSHEGSAELTFDADKQTFDGSFGTTVADYGNGQTLEGVTILWEVNVCDGLPFESAAVWW